MPSINLRPWREELRAERQKEFLSILVGTAILAAALGFLWNQYANGKIEYQNQRNAFIRHEIAQLEKQIEEIRKLRKERDELIDRMRIIQELQGTRPVIVRVFDELVRTVPEGVYFTSLEKEGSQLTLNGISDSNSRISSLLRNLSNSEWYTQPNLRSVREWTRNPEKSSFLMTVRQTTELDAEKEKASKSKKKGGKKGGKS